MHVAQFEFIGGDWASVAGEPDSACHAVLAFFSPNVPGATQALQRLRELFPIAHIVGCTTGGEILGPRSMSESFVATAVRFNSSHVHTALEAVANRRESFDVGRRIAQSLRAPDLRGILVLADGLDTNGSLLVRGLREGAGEDVVLFGGLAADGSDFVVTRVAGNSGLTSGVVVGLGLYGSKLSIAHSSACGWQTTTDGGQVTNYSGSILFEIDHEPALEWVRARSGNRRGLDLADLMARPIWIARSRDDETGVVRSVIGMDEHRGGLTLAGDISGHGPCCLMDATAENLIGTAIASVPSPLVAGPAASLTFLANCVGRKHILGASAQDEISAVFEATGGVPQVGFYAYGEIGVVKPSTVCEFQNETLAMTILSEAD